jgi:hypothetical protein
VRASIVNVFGVESQWNTLAFAAHGRTRQCRHARGLPWGREPLLGLLCLQKPERFLINTASWAKGNNLYSLCHCTIDHTELTHPETSQAPEFPTQRFAAAWISQDLCQSYAYFLLYL